MIMGRLLQDEMLPPEHMLQLYNVLKAAGSKRVVWTEFPTGNHMETYELCRQEYWPAVRAFFQQNIASGAADDVDWEYAYSIQPRFCLTTASCWQCDVI
jgi:hypothetical protein